MKREINIRNAWGIYGPTGQLVHVSLISKRLRAAQVWAAFGRWPQAYRDGYRIRRVKIILGTSIIVSTSKGKE